MGEPRARWASQPRAFSRSYTRARRASHGPTGAASMCTAPPPQGVTTRAHVVVRTMPAQAEEA
eukprot:540539-Prymnesium_polylepis.1